jgi:hypothetical protein
MYGKISTVVVFDAPKKFQRRSTGAEVCLLGLELDHPTDVWQDSLGDVELVEVHHPRKEKHGPGRVKDPSPGLRKLQIFQ